MASISIENSTSGGSDPWSITTICFIKTDGTDIKVILHCGSVLYVDGVNQEIYGMDQDEQVANAFKELAGITLQQAEHINEKLHPYFEDPMGSPSDYI